MRAVLVRAPDGSTKQVALKGERLTVGRAHDNDISYPEDASLSRHHFALEMRDGTTGQEWSVRDVVSKNGTFVNGVRITGPHSLRPGDRISGGRVIVILDSPREQSTGVTFYDSDVETPQSGTVMTSLAKVLSSEGTSQEAVMSLMAEGVSEPAMFGHPAFLALIEAGRELVGHRPLGELFEMILNLSIKTVGAERGALITVEKEGLVTRACRGEGLKISVAVRDRVLDSRESLLVKDTRIEEAFKNRQSISEQNVRAMMAVPLQTDDRVIGMIYVDSRYLIRELKTDDLNLLTVLANVAAIKIEQQRLSEIEEHDKRQSLDLLQAAEIQRKLLPERPPQLAGVDLAAHNAACRTVGGDYYDFFTYPDGTLAMVLGDVAGKGMPAAIMMTSLQARVQVLAEEGGDLGRLMTRLDKIMSGYCPSNRFVTLFYCVLDPGSGELRYCNAGHNPPLVARSGGAIERLETSGMVLGLMPGLGYEERRCSLGPGDVLAIFSDGVTEATNPQGEEFGEDRLAELLTLQRDAPAPQILDAINDAVASWTGGAPPADDVTLVIARRVH